MTDDAHLTDLRVVADEITSLLDLIRIEISQPVKRLTESHAKVRIAASPAPWNDAAGELTAVIEAGAREHEELLARIFYNGFVHRSASTGSSMAALKHLPDLIMGVREKFPDRRAWRYAENDLMSWARHCRLLLDQARAGDQQDTKAPGGLKCPHCLAHLFLPSGWTAQTKPSIYCRSCLDENGRALSWPADTWLGALQEDIA